MHCHLPEGDDPMAGLTGVVLNRICSVPIERRARRENSACPATSGVPDYLWRWLIDLLGRQRRCQEQSSQQAPLPLAILACRSEKLGEEPQRLPMHGKPPRGATSTKTIAHTAPNVPDLGVSNHEGGRSRFPRSRCGLVVGGYHIHPVFGSTCSAPPLDLENG